MRGVIRGNPCSLDDCVKEHYARGFCEMHYQRWRKHGDPLLRARSANLEAYSWLLRRLQEPFDDDCVIGPRLNGNGYALAKTGVRASHVVLEATGRPRPPAPGNLALHSCDNPPCVNPRHLRWGTNAENSDDKIGRGRHAAGERVPWAKLTADGVRLIRQLHEQGETQASLARRFGVRPNTINGIVHFKKWRHVQAENAA